MKMYQKKQLIKLKLHWNNEEWDLIDVFEKYA